MTQLIPLNVHTFNRTVNESQPVRSIDWTNPSDRKWVMNHLTWAMHNNTNVTIAHVEPESL